MKKRSVKIYLRRTETTWKVVSTVRQGSKVKQVHLTYLPLKISTFSKAHREKVEEALRERHKRFDPAQTVELVVDWENAQAKLERQREIVNEKTEYKAVFFCDIVQYSRVAAQLTIDMQVTVLNELYDLVVRVVEPHGGKVREYLGDGVYASFDHEEDAALAAIELMKAYPRTLRTWMERDSCWCRGNSLAIGISAGMVYEGMVGPVGRKQWRLVGNAVNIASHQCKYAKRRRKGKAAGSAGVGIGGVRVCGNTANLLREVGCWHLTETNRRNSYHLSEKSPRTPRGDTAPSCTPKSRMCEPVHRETTNAPAL